MSNVFVSGKLEVSDDGNLNLTGLMDKLLYALEIDHYNLSVKEFLNDEFFGSSMGDGTFAEFVETIPAIMHATQNDEMLFDGEEWRVIPYEYWDNDPFKKTEINDHVQFWEKLLSEILERPVRIEYEL